MAVAVAMVQNFAIYMLDPYVGEKDLIRTHLENGYLNLFYSLFYSFYS